MFSEDKISLLLVLFCKFIHGLNSESTHQGACTTESKCVLLKDCRSYMNVVECLEKPLKPYVIDFLRGKQCGFDEGYPKVCCSDLSTSTAHNIRETTRKSCNKNTRCALLKKCNPFLDFLKTIEIPLKPVIVDFLRAQQCGFQEGYPTVCCPRAHKNSRGLKSTKQESKTQVPEKINRSSKIQKKIDAINTEFDGEDIFGFLRISKPN